MSKSFTKYFTRYFTRYFINTLNNQSLNNQSLNNQSLNNVKNSLIICFGSVGICLHGSYALFTCKNKIIKVDKKYKFVRNGFTEFMIIDQNGKHYNVNNSFWFWKWDSNEDWNKMQNAEIRIKYYGWRIPLFGVFPNIIMSEQVRVKDY